MAGKEILLRIEKLVTRIGGETIHDELDLEVCRGEILGLVGGSGAGKSMLMRIILGLETARSGRIWLRDIDIARADQAQLGMIRQCWGVLFQGGALFSNLTVLENVEQPMREHLDLSEDMRREFAALRIRLVGLPAQADHKFPGELSGGMVKRAALARALALEPEVLILDEPASGLDPVSAAGLDELVSHLQHALGLTVIVITHDLHTLVSLCDRIAVLVDGKIIAGTLQELCEHPHPWIKAYFQGKRMRQLART